MEKTITDLKAAAYDARAAYEAAFQARKAFPEFVDGFPTLSGADDDPFGDGRGDGVTQEGVAKRRQELDDLVASTQAAWEAAEADLLNAIADETGAFKPRKHYWETDDLRGVM